MAGIERFLATRLRDLKPENWDAFVRFIGSALADLEARALASDAAAEKVVNLGLSFINESLAPALLDAAAKQTEITAIKAACVALQVQISAILSTMETEGISADVVSETAGRLWLTPALAAGWDAKADPSDIADAVDAAVAAIMGGATPATLDTLAELAAAFGNDPNALAALTATVGGKLSKSANLGDLTDVAAARTALGVLSASAIASGYLARSGGAMTGSIDWGGYAPANIPAGWRNAPAVIIEDQKSPGTDGGWASSGWQTRALNTLVRNRGSIAALASNRVTLPAGTYYAEVFAVANQVGRHMVTLDNVTDGANTLLRGPNAYAQYTLFAPSAAFASGVFTVGASKQLEVRHYAEYAKATNGLGIACWAGVAEIYTRLMIWEM